MAQDPNELVIAGTGAISVGPIGSTLPTSPTAALSGYTELGYTTEDGVKFTKERDIKDFFAWQKKDPVRRELISRTLVAAYALEQWNGDTVTHAYGGGEVTEPTPGTFRYDFPTEDDALDEVTEVIDWQDGDKHYRFVIPRGTVSENVETDLMRTELSVLPVTFKALAPLNGGIAYILTDDPAFEPAGS